MIIINGETIEVLKFDLEKYQKSRCLYALHISLEFSWQNFLFFKPWGKLDMYCNSAFDSYYSTSEEENENKISNSFFNFLMEGWLKLFLCVCFSPCLLSSYQQLQSWKRVLCFWHFTSIIQIWIMWIFCVFFFCANCTNLQSFLILICDVSKYPLQA